MKRLVVLGGGESGVGTCILAKQKGYEVFLSDKGGIKPQYRDELLNRGIEFEEGQHTEEKILSADEVVKSPGIPETAPVIQALRAKGIPVISEIEFASRYTTAKKICITGSNGKTTTTMLTYFILKEAGLNVGLAGNVGKSFAWQVAENDYDYYVLELSSFQLDGMYDFKADVAVILNITPDHLDRYDYKFQNYIEAKFRILQNQTPEDAFIYWSEDPVLKAEIAKRDILATLFPFALEKTEKGKAYVEHEEMVVNVKEEMRVPVRELPIKGTHNVYNSMAASIASQIMDIKKENIIPKTFSTVVTVDKAALRSSIERAAILVRSDKNSLIIFDISAGRIEISSNSEIGNVQEPVKAETEGHDIRIAMNSKFISEAVNALEEEKITLSFNSQVQPFICCNYENKDVLYLILPVRTANNA